MSPPPPQIKRKPKKQAWFGPNPVLENIEVVTPSVSTSSQLTTDDASRLADLESKLTSLTDEKTNIRQTVAAMVSQQMKPIVDDVKKVSDAVATMEKSVTTNNTMNTIRINKVVQGFGDTINILQKKEKRRRKRNKDTILSALNNINAKLGIPQIGTNASSVSVLEEEPVPNPEPDNDVALIPPPNPPVISQEPETS